MFAQLDHCNWSMGYQVPDNLLGQDFNKKVQWVNPLSSHQTIINFIIIFSVHVALVVFWTWDPPLIWNTDRGWRILVVLVIQFLYRYHLKPYFHLNISLFQRIRQIGGFVTTSECTLFMLMGDSKHPNFKEVQALVKTAAPDSGLLSKV